MSQVAEMKKFVCREIDRASKTNVPTSLETIYLLMKEANQRKVEATKKELCESSNSRN